MAIIYLTAHKSRVKYGRFLGNKIFALKKISGLYFNKDFKTVEDQEYFLNIIPYIKSCITVPTTYFQYRLRASSLSHSTKSLQSLDVYSSILQKPEKYEYFKPKVQSLIQERFIYFLYKQIEEDINFNIPDKIINKKISSNIQIAKSTFRQTLPDKKSLKKFKRLKNWPFLFLKWYILLRNKTSAEKISLKHKDYFD